MLVLLSLAALTWGCKSGVEDDPILRLSAAEALEQGTELMAQEKYAKARDYLTHAFEVEPNSEGGRQALLLVADSHFLQGGEVNWIRSESRYRDYLTRFPTSERADYVQYQIARSLAERVERPDRDQTATEQAIAEFATLQRLFPSSQYTPLAAEEIIRLRARLAEHHFLVGDFYLRYRNPPGAQGRFERMLEEFPDYPERDKVLFHLGRSFMMQRKYGKARETFDRLREEYPGSEWAAEIPDKIPDPLPAEAATETEQAQDEPSDDEDQPEPAADTALEGSTNGSGDELS